MNDLDLLPAKMLSSLVRPDVWLWIGLVSALWLSWRGWRKIANLVITSLVAAVMLVGFVPVGDVWLGPLEQHHPTRPTLTNPPSAIIVLGGGEDARTSSAWNSMNLTAAGDRLLQALIRAQAFAHVPVLLTGGAFDPTGDPRKEGGAERAGAMLEAAGIEGERLHIAPGARRTAEHPADIAAFLAETGITPSDEAPLLIITSAYHMPRAMGVLCTAGIGPALADPTDHRTVPNDAWQHQLRWSYAGNLANLQLGIREWAALLAYWRAGHTNGLLPEPCTSS